MPWLKWLACVVSTGITANGVGVRTDDSPQSPAGANRPSVITSMRFARSATRGSCVTITTAVRSSAWAWNRASITRSPFSVSSAPVGSSHGSRGGSLASARDPNARSWKPRRYEVTGNTRCVPDSPFISTSRGSPKAMSPPLSANSLSNDETRISPPDAWPAMRAARFTSLP